MYPQFFGFDRLPFRLGPDAESLYSSPEYRAARSLVLAALRGSSRVVLVLGGPGVGKTLLLEDILRESADFCNACRINQPQIAASELLQALLMRFGTTAGDDDGDGERDGYGNGNGDGDGDAHGDGHGDGYGNGYGNGDGEADGAELLQELSAVLTAADARGAALPLLIIDDAQLLPGATLHTLREILAGAPRLKILLAGQGDLEQRLAALTAGGAAAREPPRVRLSALNGDGTKAYVEHRLRVAGGGARELFAADAYSMIFRHTGGIARLINVLCDGALYAACLRSSGQVGAAEILAATQDPRWPQAVAREKARPDAPAWDLGEDSPPDATPVRAQLVVSYREKLVTTWPLQPGRISIGRSRDNELRLDAPFVSRHHCQIVTAGEVSTIEDLESANGIKLNGHAVKRHVLQHSDQVVIGGHLLVYEVC